MSDNALSPTAPAATSYPPATILFIVALCVLVSVSAAAEVIESWVDGRFFHFDFGVCALPIAFGLLARKHSSRRWALFFAAFGLIGGGAVFVLALANGASGPALGWTLFYTGVAAALGLSSIVMLRSTNGRAWFAAERSPMPNSWMIVFPIMVPAAIAVFDGVVTKRSLLKERQALVDSAFPVNCHFIFLDATTGKRTPSPSFGLSPTSSSGRDDLPPTGGKIWFISAIDAGIPTIIVQGLAFAPYPLHFTADGYQPTDFTITKDTPERVEVRLQPAATP